MQFKGLQAGLVLVVLGKGSDPLFRDVLLAAMTHLITCKCRQV